MRFKLINHTGSLITSRDVLYKKLLQENFKVIISFDDSAAGDLFINISNLDDLLKLSKTLNSTIAIDTQRCRIGVLFT